MAYIFRYFTFLIVLFSQISWGQNSNVWMLGWNASGLTQTNWGINFNSGTSDTFSVIRPMNFNKTNTSVCDSLGNLLFYSNGVGIANRMHSPLLNESNFNPGYLSSGSPNGLSLYDGCVIVSNPDNAGKYFIIHESADTVNFGLYTYTVPVNLSYSEIDMTLDGGLGGVTSSKKDLHVIDDTLTLGKLSAIRHANGRDWWVITHELNTNNFYKLLVTPDSISLTQSQAIGSIHSIVLLGQSAFSPDGKKYVIQNSDTSVELFDFDRCTGLFSNPITIVISDSTLVLTGESFSKSNRFLYVNNNINIRQFDLNSSNIAASVQIVGVWDGSVPPSRFRVNKLAPDGKIYIAPRDGCTTIHYIESPDSLGVSCNVIQNGLVTPTPNNYSFPNLPDFNLGPDTLTICDSLFNLRNDRLMEEISVEVYPNPFQKDISISFENSDFQGSIVIYNSIGEIVFNKPFINNESKLILYGIDFPDGLYFIQFYDGKKIYRTKKVIKTW